MAPSTNHPELAPVPLSCINHVGYASPYETPLRGSMLEFDEARTAVTARVVGIHSHMCFAQFCKAYMCKACRGLFRVVEPFGISIPRSHSESHRLCGYRHRPCVIADRSVERGRHDGEQDGRAAVGRR